MSITATLKVVLFANDVAVAESEDAALWQQVLGQINGTPYVAASGGAATGVARWAEPLAQAHGADTPIATFAAQLQVDESRVVGACSPSSVKPYLHLDAHFWAAFRSNFPATGPNAVSGTLLAATLLVLWQHHAGIERVTTSDVQAVLETVSGDSSTIARSVRRCPWLQLRDDQIRLNPAEIARAESVARAFCLKQPEETLTQH